MAGMVREPRSISAIALELGCDRRTVSRCLHEVKPAGSGPRGPLYFTAEVYRKMTAPYDWGSRDAMRRDRLARAYLEHFGRKADLEVLAARIAGASSPEARSRVVREFFASTFWTFIRTGNDPACPDWSEVSDRAFERAWRTLVRDVEPLDEVATVAAGGRTKREEQRAKEAARIRALRTPQRGGPVRMARTAR